MNNLSMRAGLGWCTKPQRRGVGSFGRTR